MLRIAVIAAVLAIGFLVASADWIQKELWWMRQLGDADVFWTIMSLRWGLFCAAFVATFLYLWVNLRVAIKNGEILHSAGPANEFSAGSEEPARVSPAHLAPILTVLAGAAALMLAFIYYGQRDTFLRFRCGGSFGFSGPLFGVGTGVLRVSPAVLRTLAEHPDDGDVRHLSGRPGLLRPLRADAVCRAGRMYNKAVPHLCILLGALVA